MGCPLIKSRVRPEQEEVTKTVITCASSINKLGLTTQQTFKLKKNWKAIKRKLKGTGIELFLRLVLIKIPGKDLVTKQPPWEAIKMATL